MTTIIKNIDLLKQIQPLLENIDCEYTIKANMNNEFDKEIIIFTKKDFIPEYVSDELKTLTFEEFLDFIPYDFAYGKKISLKSTEYWLNLKNKNKNINESADEMFVSGDNKQQLIEKTLLLLIDNNKI